MFGFGREKVLTMTTSSPMTTADRATRNVMGRFSQRSLRAPLGS
jgi:hypothetical protein